MLTCMSHSSMMSTMLNILCGLLRNALLVLVLSPSAALAFDYGALVRWRPVIDTRPVSYRIEIISPLGAAPIVRDATPVLAPDGALEYRVIGLQADASFRLYSIADGLQSAASNTIIVQIPPDCATCDVCSPCVPCTGCSSLPDCAPHFIEPNQGTFALARTDTAFGGSALMSIAKSNKTTIEIDFPAAGTWYLWGRFYAPGAPGSNDANSFFASVDDGPRVPFGNSLDAFQLWYWGGDGKHEHGVPLPLALDITAPGLHTITIAAREVSVTSQPMLDLLYLSQEPAAPTDADAWRALVPCF